MKFGKKLFYVLAFVGIAALAVGCHGRFHKEDFAEHVLEHIDDHAEDFDLNADQKEKYQDIRSRLEADLKKRGVGHKEFKQNLYDAISEDNPDIVAVKGMLKTKLDGMSEAGHAYLDYMEEFYNILNEEQRNELLKQARKKMKRCVE